MGDDKTRRIFPGIFLQVKKIEENLNNNKYRVVNSEEAGKVRKSASNGVGVVEISVAGSQGCPSPVYYTLVVFCL